MTHVKEHTPGAHAGTLASIVARAAAPSERAALSCFRPAVGDDGGLAARREARWCEAVAGGDAARFAEHLAARGLPADTFRAGLADVEVVPGQPLPRWAADLGALMDALACGEGEGAARAAVTLGEMMGRDAVQAAGVDPGTAWPLAPVFARLMDVGAARLAAVIDGCPVEVEEGAARELLAGLARRFAAVATATLTHRLGDADVLTGHPGRSGQSVAEVFFPAEGGAAEWLRCLDAYPVLGRLLAVAFRNWEDAARELLGRVAGDRALLERTFAPAGLGALRAVAADAGDVHDHGRTVSLLTFASGVRIVYKPKDLRILDAWAGLVEALNRAAPDPGLRERRVLVRDGYAWDELVPTQPCQDAAAVSRYFRRVGAYARLAQLLDATDWVAENWIAAGEHPVPIDVETLLSPRAAPGPGQSATERALGRARDDSPARSAMLSARISGEPGRRTAELGLLGPAHLQQAPFRLAMRKRGDDGVERVVSDWAWFPGSRALPVLDGAPVDAAPHFAEVVAGYVEMGRVLRGARAGLLADGGPLARMADAPVRFVYRDTHVYARLLLESLRPARMRDGVARETCLERLWKAQVRGDGAPALVQSEVDALRDLDIPLFRSRPASDEVLLWGGGQARAAFDGAALDRVRQRLLALDAATEPDDEDGVRSVLFALAPHADSPPRITHRPHPSPSTSAATPEPTQAPVGTAATGTGVRDDGGWLEQAVRVGDLLLATAVHGAPGEIGWAGLAYAHWSDAWRFEPLGDDLLSGSAGIALALAELYRATGQERFRSAAASALAPLAARLEKTVDSLADGRPGQGPPFRCGGLAGCGAWLYACVRGGTLVGAVDLADRARAAARRLDAAALRERSGADWTSGRAGLAAALAATADGDATLLTLASALASGLRAELAAGPLAPQPYPDDARPLDALPSTSAGIALALARVAASEIAIDPSADGDPTNGGSSTDLPSGNQGSTENPSIGGSTADAPAADSSSVEASNARSVDAESGSTDAVSLDTTSADVDVDADALTPGAVLARLALARLDPSTIADALARADALLGGEVPVRAADVLAHADVAITAFALAGRSADRRRAEALGATPVRSNEMDRTWLPGTLASDRHLLSAVWGTAAVARLFLRLHDPAATGSAVLLD
ncbi:MAG: uncharacterized protein JWM27_2131 [Gemmatimonadetes bacterium]|nr:uncharacterized protein [Gemmatimonadota bacterium]